MLSVIILAFTITAASDDTPAIEIARTSQGEMMSLTNAGVPYTYYRLAIAPSPGETNEIVFYLDRSKDPHRPNRELPDTVRLGGPVPWGVVGEAAYVVAHYRPGLADDCPPLYSGTRMTTIDAHIGLTNLIVDLGRRGSTDRAGAARFEEFRASYASHCTPLMAYIGEYAPELYANWDITFDYVYTSLEDVTVVALRQGRMHRWVLDDTGVPRHAWDAHHPFATPIRGVFRILRGGKDLANMYFVDETGSIHIGFGAEHRKIGTVRDYHHADETTLTLLFEDQMTEKIGFLHAAEDGTITVLPIDWQDESFAADFLTELDADRTRAGVVRLAEVLREDAEEGGE